MNTQAMVVQERSMPDQLILSPGAPKCVGIVADHGGYALKEYLGRMLRQAGADVIDFCDRQPVPDEGYPNFIVPLARAVAKGEVERGVAICYSGVGASVVANKVAGVRACLIHESFSAHQGVEDDNLNLICLSGLVVGYALAWKLVHTFLVACFSGIEPHRRRRVKVAELEYQHLPKTICAAPQAEKDQTQTTATGVSKNAGHARPLRVHLIRHGETEWSLSGRYTGSTDIALTPQGENEARKVGQRLHGIPFAHVLTSPLRRAQQTCALAALEGTPEIEPDLAEWDNGDDEGRTPADILASRPDWNLFRDGSPNGESPDQICTRADRLIVRLRTLNGNVALFTHGHFGRVLAARWIGLSVGQAQPFLLNTASLSILCYAHGHSDLPAIELWNSTSPQAPSDPAPQLRGDNTRQMEEHALAQWDNEGGMTPNDHLTQQQPTPEKHSE